MLFLPSFVQYRSLSWSIHQTTTLTGILTSLLLLRQFKPLLRQFKPLLRQFQPLFKPLFKPQPLFKPLLPLLPCTRYGPKTCRKL